MGDNQWNEFIKLTNVNGAELAVHVIGSKINITLTPRQRGQSNCGHHTKANTARTRMVMEDNKSEQLQNQSVQCNKE